MSLIDPDRMALLKRLFPVLGKHLRKGDCGKIGVIGGSPDYTGAPYFASITPMKIGADLTFVYAHSDAAGVIKSYSPELIVYPSTDFAANRQSIDRLDALVFGPGLGRQKHTLNLLMNVVNFVRDKPKLCLVIDADGLFYINDCLELFKGCSNNVIITPNHREFVRLFTQMFPKQKGIDTDELAVQRELTDQLAKHLQVCVMRKGENDIISDGSNIRSRIGQAETSMRRCGGQGDILSGATAIFAFWAKKASGSEVYSSEHLLDGAEAASSLVRKTSLRAFEAVGRSMNAADVIDHIGPVIRHIDSTIVPVVRHIDSTDAGAPTKVLCFMNMVTEEELQQEEDYKDIFEQIYYIFTTNFGNIVRMEIPWPGSEKCGKVFIEFQSKEVSQRAKAALTGAKRDNRDIVANFFDPGQF